MPRVTRKRALGAAVTAAAALSVVACSLGLPDNVEGYNRPRGQEGRPDAPASTVVGTPVLPPYDGGVVTVDGAVVTEGGVPGPPACPPQPLVNFVPRKWIPPAPIHRNACTAQQASLLVDCLMTTVGNTPACDNFMYSSQNGFCIQCGLTSVNAQRLGPILDDGVSYYTNPAGCIAALSGDGSATGCGATFDALMECENTACQKCSDQDYLACANAADQGPCKAYAHGLTCSSIYSTACLGTSPVDEALKLVKLSCMP